MTAICPVCEKRPAEVWCIFFDPDGLCRVCYGWAVGILHWWANQE